jgi:uncharacterized protein YceK
MKYLFSFLVIVLLSGCGSPAGRVVKKIGYTVKQCCASLSFPKENAPVSLGSTEHPVAGSVAVAIFEPEMQLIHTW